MDNHTEQAATSPTQDDVPPLMFWSLWISVFCVLIYGFGVLFGTFRTPLPTDEPHDPT